jgi:hypothetical protein
MKTNIEQIYWFLAGDLDIASSRLQGYLIHKGFMGRGIKSHIIYAPKSGYSYSFPSFASPPRKIDLHGSVSVIQKLKGNNTKRLIEWLKGCGSHVCYVNCDLDEQDDTWVIADTVLVTSEILRQYYVAHGRSALVIPEPYEYSSRPDISRCGRNYSARKVIWFGHRDNWEAILRWKRIIEQEFQDSYTLITCSNHPDATIPWSPGNVQRLLSDADLAILPTMDIPAFSVKSPNRLIQCMAMGVPTLVGPLQSYEQLLTRGLPVLLARTDNDFRLFLAKLQDNVFRQEIGRRGFDGVVSLFSIDSVIIPWADALGIDLKKCSNSACFCLSTTKLKLMLWYGRIIPKHIQKFSPFFKWLSREKL